MSTLRLARHENKKSPAEGALSWLCFEYIRGRLPERDRDAGTQRYGLEGVGQLNAQFLWDYELRTMPLLE